MAKKAPKGRPSSSTSRPVVVCSRLTAAHAAKLKKLAKGEGVSISDWIHRRLLWELR